MITLPYPMLTAEEAAELIHDGSDGWLVDCGDVSALAAAIRESQMKPERGEVGRQRALREFAWEPKLDLVREQMLLKSKAAVI